MHWSIRLLLTLMFVLFCRESFAQMNTRDILRNNVMNRPTVSPYLQLTRRNANGVSNYHTQVRPQLEARSARRQQDASISQLRQQISRVQNRQRRTQTQGFATGHPTRFMNYLHYYQLR